MLRMGEIAFLREEHTNSLSSTKGLALETHKEHYEDWAGCVYVFKDKQEYMGGFERRNDIL